MGRTRPLAEEDLPRIAELYTTVFGSRNGHSSDDVASYLRDVLCRHPWVDPSLPSLVHEEGGRIVGCLGVMPRRMSIEGAPLQAAVSHNFMVDPSSRSSMAALELGKAFLSGRQDLSLAEGGDRSRRLLEGFGGATALLYSLRWTRPLRPARYALSFLRRRGLPFPIVAALAPLCGAADAVGAWMTPGSLRPTASRLSADDLGCEALCWLLAEVPSSRALRPEYDLESLSWLLDHLERKRGRGTLRKAALRDDSGEMVGWYLYYLNPGGISEVLQVAGRDDSFADVLEHLLHDAWQGGSVAISGQLDPTRLQDFWKTSCLFHHDGASWMLVHSRRRAVLEAIHRGDTFLTRLEGEWWIGL